MALPKNPKNEGVKRNLPPEGLEPARCFAIIDIGTQVGMFEGKPKTPAREIMFFFELTNYSTVYREGDMALPYVMGQNYTYSLGDKAKLPNMLKQWFKQKEIKNYDNLPKIVGQYAMINVVHSKDGNYANIGSSGRGINPYMDAIPKPTKHYDTIYFEMPEVKKGEAFDWDLFKTFPMKAQKAIRQSVEFKDILHKFPEPTSDNSTSQAESSSINDDDEVPF